MSRKLLVVPLAVIAVVAGVSAWALWPREADEVSQRDAVADFREHASSTTDAASASTVSDDPEPGVYSYAASGTEKSKFGPLPENENPLPTSVTAAVVTRPGDCFTFRLNLFEQHTEDSRFCNGDDGFTLASYAKNQTVGALTATAKVTCDQGLLIGPESDRQDLDCVLKLKGGPFTVDADFTGTSKVGAAEQMRVGDDEIEVTPVTIHFDFTGKVEGTWTEKTWFAADHLPVRIERSLDMKGKASFNEQFDLKLASLQPTT